MRIDSHQHYWRYTAEDYSWINDDMAVLKSDFEPSDSIEAMNELGFEASVAVQVRHSLKENDFLLALADEYDSIAGVVGWVDLCSDRIDEDLQAYIDHPKFVGLRHIVQDEPDPEFLLQEDFIRGVKRLQNYELTYDLLIFEKHLEVADRFLSKAGEHRIVLDHLAKPKVKTGEIEHWEKGIRKLAKHEHLFCKVSGLTTEADWKHWKPADFRPYLDLVLDAFGVDRLMIGSDWPVCLLSSTYQSGMTAVMDYFSKLSSNEQTAIYGENAIHFYNLPVTKGTNHGFGSQG